MSKRLLQIDILRGIAAVSVTYFHLSGSSGLSDTVSTTGRFGYLGVEIFFVISGFVLPYSMYKNTYTTSNFFTFLLKRILRIDPPYFSAITIAILMMLLTSRALPNTNSLVFHVGYLNGILDLPWVSPVFWTLALEFQFYLFLGLFFNFIADKSALGFLFLTGILFLGSLYLNDAFLPKWFGFFALGMSLFRKQYCEMSNTLYWASTLCIFIFIAITNGLPECLAGLFTIIFILFVKINHSNKLTKIGLWLGMVSYSLYLTHWEFGRTAIAIFRHLPLIGEWDILRLLLGLLTTILSGWLFYKLIEKPAIRLSNKIKYN